MPSVVASAVSVPWRDAAGAAAAVSAPWRDGTDVASTGSPFTAPGAPGGSTPTAGSLAADYVLAAAAAYHVVHTVTVTDLRDDAAIEFEQMSIAADEGGVCWTLTASGPASLFARFTADSVDKPVVLVTIDGLAWQFIIERVSRNRSGLANAGVSVSGRSLTITAGEPYQYTQNWINQGPASAAQLVDHAQLYTGLQVNWLLEDWLVPDKVWSFSGSPMAVAKRVAESVSAVVRSARTDLTISIMPRYPVLPHLWPYEAPDVDLHIDAAMTDSYDRDDKPGYNGVYVSGQQQGVVGFVYLDGTPGDLLAPLVTDLLLTDEAAVRQRGIAILGASGPQARVQMTLPVLTGAGEPGVLDLGMLCRVIDDETEPWYGMVRAVSVSVSLPSVLQTITLERHTAPIPGTVVADPGPDPTLTRVRVTTLNGRRVTSTGARRVLTN
jgi:hypothetical protein